MSSDKLYGTVVDKQGTGVLTTTLGDESAGWTTVGIDVSMFEFVSFELDYSAHDSATLLTLAFLACDRAAGDLDDYVPITSYGSGGALEDDILTLALTANVKKVTPPMDVRAVSMLRVAAMVDDATGGPTLALRYLGHRKAGVPAQEQTPDVAS